VGNAHPNGLAGPVRRIVSHSCRVLVRMLFPSIRTVHDPLGGLFAMHESVIDGAALDPEGFKILLVGPRTRQLG